MALSEPLSSGTLLSSTAKIDQKDGDGTSCPNFCEGFARHHFSFQQRIFPMNAQWDESITRKTIFTFVHLHFHILSLYKTFIREIESALIQGRIVSDQ